MKLSHTLFMSFETLNILQCLRLKAIRLPGGQLKIQYEPGRRAIGQLNPPIDLTI